MDYLETIKLYEYGKIDTDELVRCVNEKVDSFFDSIESATK